MKSGSRRFRTSLLGFNRRDVTSYLSTIFDETERILEDNERRIGHILAEAEMQAQLRAQAIIAEAENKAQAILAAAMESSDAVRHENMLIRNHNMELLEGAERAFEQLKGEIYRLQQD